MLTFVNGFLSVSNVGKKMTAKYKGRGFMAKNYDINVRNTRGKNYMPWTEKCQFLLVAF